jgi:hypothetical protein
MLVSLVIAASTLGVTAPATLGYSAHVWSNENAFKGSCLGFTSSYPKLSYELNKAQIAKLGFSPVGGVLGASFTRANFTDAVLNDYAVYVHSHGDNYWVPASYPKIDSAFLQDPGIGKCNTYADDKVLSSSIRAATIGTTYNLVIMSTCKLGSSKSTMPGAFQIAMTKASTEPEFYLGYVNTTYDSASYAFEAAFWSYMNGGAPHSRTFFQAFVYATALGGYTAVNASNPFQANWWGNPTYNGTPTQPAPVCTACPL